MMKAALSTEQPDIMTPTYDRLSKSGLKAAMLLAASRQRHDAVIVEATDMLRAIHYVEGWRVHTNAVIKNLGKGSIERQLDKITAAIVRKPGIARSTVMQTYHLQAREASQILDTLEQRGVITRTRKGRSEVLFPISFVMNQAAQDVPK
jgi:hypothetical protein